MRCALSGPPGIGKTTIARRCVDLLAARGLRVAGLLTREMRDARGAREGFRIENIASGESRVMAHRDFVSRERVGRYGVDVEIISYMSDVALSARAIAAADVVVVDEVGKMECFSTRFVRAVSQLCDADGPLLLTVAAHGDGLIAEIAARDDVITTVVTRDNRDTLPQSIVTTLCGGVTHP